VQSKLSIEAISKVLDKCPEPTSPPLLLTDRPVGAHTSNTTRLTKAGWSSSHYPCKDE
jgi:hypothetical protein